MNFLSKISLRLTPSAAVGVLALCLFSACFTGVEGTKKIEISKAEEKEYQPTEEDIFIADIQATPLSDWQKGKEFFLTEDRVALIFDGLAADADKLKLGGKTVSYDMQSSRKDVDGKDIRLLIFTDGTRQLCYNTGKQVTDTIMSDQLPMMIDFELIKKLKQKLIGKHLWTKSSIWYDSEGNTIKGKKYVPITIIDVLPGDKVFPAKVVFQDEAADTAAMLMNIGSFGIESRSFATIFSLSDVRLKYPKTEDDVWLLIQSGEIRNGMTKQECSLSLGLPKEISQGHDYSRTLELWQYSDGVYLQFEDGILVNFRR